MGGGAAAGAVATIAPSLARRRAIGIRPQQWRRRRCRSGPCARRGARAADRGRASRRASRRARDEPAGSASSRRWRAARRARRRPAGRRRRRGRRGGRSGRDPRYAASADDRAARGLSGGPNGAAPHDDNVPAHEPAHEASRRPGSSRSVRRRAPAIRGEARWPTTEPQSARAGPPPAERSWAADTRRGNEGAIEVPEGGHRRGGGCPAAGPPGRAGRRIFAAASKGWWQRKFAIEPPADRVWQLGGDHAPRHWHLGARRRHRRNLVTKDETATLTGRRAVWHYAGAWPLGGPVGAGIGEEQHGFIHRAVCGCRRHGRS